MSFTVTNYSKAKLLGGALGWFSRGRGTNLTVIVALPHVTQDRSNYSPTVLNDHLSYTNIMFTVEPWGDG